MACKAVAAQVRKAGIAGLYGLHGSTNVTGDAVKKLDVIANETFIEALSFVDKVGLLISEEDELIIELSGHDKAKYVVAFDPLDGSSNIDAGVSIGTIWGIWKQDEGDMKAEDALRPGRELVSAGYCLYGSSCMLVTSIGHGVQVFTLDPAIGEFILTQRDLQMPEKPKRIYSCNEGNYSSFDTPTQKFLTECKEGPTAFSARYVGSMVADVHRTLQYGGIFMYPATAKAPEGKLRLLYEGAPMAFLCEKAGGMASLGRADRLSGSSRVLDLCPRHIHQVGHGNVNRTGMECQYHWVCLTAVSYSELPFSSEARWTSLPWRNCTRRRDLP
jgi:fructose-1,6-bisphosphatase I